MKLTKVMKGVLAAASIALVGSFAQAQQAGGSLVFLVPVSYTHLTLPTTPYV